MPKLQIIVTPLSGISYHRFVNPISYLDMGPDWTIELLWFGEDEHRIDCDILWYSKYLMTEPKWLKRLQDKGTRIIVDIDDSWDLPVSHPRYKEWTDAGRDKATIENIKIADVVTCSTMKVQDMVRQYNKNTVVIPNAFPYGHDNYQPIAGDTREKMTFIYSGGSTHYSDVRLLEGKFKRIGSDPFLYNNSEYLLAGYEPQQKRFYQNLDDMKAKNNNFVTQQVHGEWDKMTSIFKYSNSYRILPSINLDDYLSYYDMADVSLIPLQQHSWNSYKSVLKVLEAAVKKIPVICSKVEPYYPELRDYPGILWVEGTNWLDPIKFCIKNKEEAQAMGEELAAKVWKEYDLIIWNNVRKQLLERLV